MNEKKCLEVCADSYASAMAAVRGGADRIELCTCLLAGGLTPDPVLLEQIREKSDIEIRCLMRPRFGDFLYSEAEISMMEEQMRRLSAAGADGFVIGCLTPDGDLNTEYTERLCAAAGGKGLTLHRAFDVCRDGFRTAMEASELGIDTVLTSGQAVSCWEGREYINALLNKNLPVTIMAGAGVDAGIIRKMRRSMPINTFHMSGKTTVQSRMIFRRQGVPMGLPGIDEFSIWQTDEAKVRAAAEALAEQL